MTTTDPFTTPAEAEREARVKQAHDLLASAAGIKELSTYNYDTGRRSYKGGVEAVRDALVGQGYATLAVRDELADIAASLRALARTPYEVQQLAKHVSFAGKAVQDRLADLGNEVHDLCATVNQGVEFADSTAAAAGSISVSMHDLIDVADRPRWWQWRLRRALRRQDVEGGEPQ